MINDLNTYSRESTNSSSSVLITEGEEFENTSVWNVLRPSPFEFVPLPRDVKYRFRSLPSAIDKLGLTEDFRTDKITLEEIGYSHAIKRLKLFHALASYIELIAGHLTDYEIPKFEQHQYFATEHFVPVSFLSRKTHYANYERIHISALSKLVLKNQSQESFKLKGSLLLDGKKTDLTELLNLCDIGDQILNKIDWVFEMFLRFPAVSMLNEVKRRDKTAFLVATRFANLFDRACGRLDFQLMTKKTVVYYKMPERLEKEYRATVGILVQNRRTAGYLKGFYKALHEFKSYSADELHSVELIT